MKENVLDHDVHTKVTVKVSLGGQKTLKKKNGEWVNPSILSSDIAQTLSNFKFTSRAGCREACQQIVVEMLNEGFLAPVQSAVTDVCHEIGRTGLRIGGYYQWLKNGSCASAFYRYPGHEHDGLDFLDTSDWTKHRTLAAAKTFKWFYDRGSKLDKSHLKNSAELRAAEMMMKAGTIIANRSDTCMSLYKTLCHGEELKFSTVDRDGTLLVSVASQRINSKDNMLELAKEHERYLLKQRPSTYTSHRYDQRSLVLTAAYIAAHPHCTDELLESAGSILNEVPDDIMQQYIYDKMSADHMTDRDKTYVVLFGLANTLTGPARMGLVDFIKHKVDGNRALYKAYSMISDEEVRNSEREVIDTIKEFGEELDTLLEKATKTI